MTMAKKYDDMSRSSGNARKRKRSLDEITNSSIKRTNILKELSSSASAFMRSSSQSTSAASPSRDSSVDEKIQALENKLHSLTTRQEALLALGSTRSGTLETISLLEKRLKRLQSQYAELLDSNDD